MSACHGKRFTAVVLSVVIGCWGCSPDSGGGTICDPLAPECADGLVCESVAGGESQCVAPLVIVDHYSRRALGDITESCGFED